MAVAVSLFSTVIQAQSFEYSFTIRRIKSLGFEPERNFSREQTLIARLDSDTRYQLMVFDSDQEGSGVGRSRSSGKITDRKSVV